MSWTDIKIRLVKSYQTKNVKWVAKVIMVSIPAQNVCFNETWKMTQTVLVIIHWPKFRIKMSSHSFFFLLGTVCQTMQLHIH